MITLTSVKTKAVLVRLRLDFGIIGEPGDALVGRQGLLSPDRQELKRFLSGDEEIYAHGCSPGKHSGDADRHNIALRVER